MGRRVVIDDAVIFRSPDEAILLPYPCLVGGPQESQFPVVRLERLADVVDAKDFDAVQGNNIGKKRTLCAKARFRVLVERTFVFDCQFHTVDP